MILYRGDKSQWARDARLAGIMTRLMDGGKPATVSAVGLWEAARAHVRPQGIVEEAFLRTTPFLSFTESIEIAARYALGLRGEGRLQACATQYGEDTVIFELDTEGMTSAGHDGSFILDYPCNMELADPLGAGAEFEGREKYVQCEYCLPENAQTLKSPRFDSDGRLLHRIQLIHVPRLLATHPDRARYVGASNQAAVDREWLIYPLDYVSRLRGNAAKVQLANFWRVTRHMIVRAGQASG